nr:superoxide dismutase [Candidatus Synchoanobacter obligatus]
MPELPFSSKDLEPFISEKTLSFHYGKHHKTYVDKLNGLIEKTEYASTSLENIIRHSDGAIFNNAAQVWNHTFYWNCLAKPSNQKPSTELQKAITRDFGSIEEFTNTFSNSAIGLFGSGWCWLVISKDHKLSIVNTQNAQTPLTTDHTALLTCDVWEHAYYLDTQNSRPEYLKNFWAIVNWAFVSEQYQKHLEQYGNT